MRWDEVPDWANIIAQSLLEAIKARDPYTYGHCGRVGRYARLLAKAAGLSEADQKMIELSGLFHDLGKLGIPDRILLKPGRLTLEEEELMRTHPIKSAEILEPLTAIPFFKGLIPGVRYHHERIDGLGYPYGIQGEDIPLSARIVLIVDTFDAMTTTRPYRKGRGVDFAYKELRQFSGRQFDSQLVDIFLKSHPHWGEMEKEISEEFVAALSKIRIA
jgi:HD-GYP domain-containing protein (c-di-GMP phosphodiesterase class II)